MSNDTTRAAYDQQLRETGGKGTRREMGTVRKTDFRKPKAAAQQDTNGRQS
jgi:hypothetical protein